jgi:type IV secretory pathway TrbF-like protein
MFRRPSVRYGRTPEPETPYQRGPKFSVTPIKSKQLRLPAI